MSHCSEHASYQPPSHHAASHSLQEGALDIAGVPCSEVIDLNPFCETPAPDGAKHTLRAVVFYNNRHYIACRRHRDHWVAYNDERMYLLAHEVVRLADLGAPGLFGQISKRPAALPPCPCLPVGGQPGSPGVPARLSPWSAAMHHVPGLSEQASGGGKLCRVYQSMANACGI